MHSMTCGAFARAAVTKGQWLAVWQRLVARLRPGRASMQARGAAAERRTADARSGHSSLSPAAARGRRSSLETAGGGSPPTRSMPSCREAGLAPSREVPHGRLQVDAALDGPQLDLPLPISPANVFEQAGLASSRRPTRTFTSLSIAVTAASSYWRKSYSLVPLSTLIRTTGSTSKTAQPAGVFTTFPSQSHK